MRIIAWETGDPGIQFHDRMNKDNPVPSLGNIRATNPCSEFSAVDNSSCNLASMNLVKYFTRNGFDWEGFRADVRIMITAMDILIDAADYPTPEIAEMTKRTRPLGLGFSNLGAYLVLVGVAYDSPRAREIAADITWKMTRYAYTQSMLLAEKLGSFEAFEKNKRACQDIAARVCSSRAIEDEIDHFGLRNSQLTLLAPTGTISFMMDCDTTGIEPLFALKATKQLAGGGTLEIIPDCVERKSMELGGQMEPEDFKEETRSIFKTAGEIHWKDHIRMMAACQKHLNGAISKTINMPADSTVEDVFDAYKFAWEEGLKSVAIYRDGSKSGQPLTDSSKALEIARNSAPIYKPTRNKLPDTRQSQTHAFDIGGFKGYMQPGMYPDGTLGEIFLTASKNGSTIQGLLDSFATVTSLALQHGVPLDLLCDKFIGVRYEPSGFTQNKDIPMCKSIVDYVFRWLAREYLNSQPKEVPSIPPPSKGTLDGPPCKFCGGLTELRGTCYVCPECGETTGCG